MKPQALRVILSIVALPLLSACALPVAATAISVGFGGLSYATTGKSMTDNYLSHFTKADCAMHRIAVEGTPICIIQPDTAIAEANTDLAAERVYLAGGADDEVIFSQR